MDKPYATFTLKLYEDKDFVCETQWAALDTKEQRAKLVQALENALAVERRQAAAS